MGGRIVKLAVLAAVVAAALTLSAGAAGPPRNFQFGPCPDGVTLPDVQVDCGTLTVPETRGSHAAGRRMVTLPVAIIRSPDRTHADPVLFIDGGPSYDDFDGFTSGFLAALPIAAHRDVILYDPRGVGLATPRLGCPEFDQVRADAFGVDPLYQYQAVSMFLAADSTCRQRLAGQGIDLRSYDTTADAQDVNDLRLALGYKRWNLFALSAGGVIALTEMRLFPEGLRSVALDSPVGNQLLIRGPDRVRSNERMLGKVFAGCAADAACNEAHPHLRERFYQRVDALRRHPVTLDIPVDPSATAPIKFDGDLVLNMAYCLDPICAAGSPRVLDELARGDLADFAADVFGGPLTPAPPIDPIFSEGKSAIIHCRDYIAFEPHSELTAAARELPEWAGTLLSSRFPYTPTDTREACDRWHVGRADRAQHEPVRSSIPTLLLTGDWDGVIGPPTQQRIASYLPNSYQFVFPGIGHATTFWSDCPGVIMGEFVDAPARKPDASCIAEMPDVSFNPDG